jgi:hypothetical protein
MNNYLILRTLNSPYNDVSKGSVLSHSELDDNFIFLKGNIIYTATTNAGMVTLKKYNGDDITYIGGGSGIFSGGTVTGPTTFIAGLTANTINTNTISASTLILNGVAITSLNNYVTGGTYNSSNGTLTLNTGSGGILVTGFTSGGGGCCFSGGTVTGATNFTAGLTANTISATTYYGLPKDVYVTGGTYSNGSTTFKNNNGDTFSVSGFSTGTNFTGGTVTGGTSFTGGLTANTISATTYYGLPKDVYVTGGTYNSSNGTTTFRNNNADTFSVSGFSTGTTGGFYWISGSTGTQSLKTINNSTVDATGNYSIASGFNTLSSGIASHAEGGDTKAQNDYSHAEGNFSIASGVASHAEGSSTLAEGDYSHAEGLGDTAGSVIARGTASHAEGRATLAEGNFSHAEGNLTIASGFSSHAQNILTNATGEFSHAGGAGFDTTAYVIAYGDVSFVHQYNSGAGQFGTADYGAYGNYSSILGGKDHYISLGSESGAIMGGNGHLLYGISLNSAIFGGNANLLVDTFNGVVLGGDANGTIQADNSAIIAGYNNVIDAYLYNGPAYGFIGGGTNNKISTGGGVTDESSVIMGGNGNIIEGDNQYNGIYNSFTSTLTSQDTSTIIGSYQCFINDYDGGLTSHNNDIINASDSFIDGYGVSHANILGGANNSIVQNVGGVNQPNFTSILNGFGNTIQDSDTAVILNGFQNTISGNSKQSSILNGQDHLIASSQFSAIIGGNSNEMTDSDGSALIGGSNNGILSDSNPAFTRYYNAILGGTGNTINNSELCFIMGGYQNLIPYGTVGSVILGGDSITANTNNTVFVQRLNIKYAQNDNLTTKLLTVDANGLVKYRDVSSISGGTGSGGTTIDLYWASGTTGAKSIKANNGTTTDATSDYAVAYGFNALASGIYSHAEGNGTESRARSSHAQNEGTLARGNYSHAGGFSSIASGLTSFVHSYQSTANGDRSVVLGGSGINGSSNDTVYVPYFNITSASTNNDLSSILVRESNGDVKIKTLVSITGGTFNNSNGSISFTNSTGGTSFTVTNLNNFGNITATSVTTTAITSNTISAASISATSVTAVSISATTISATTYLGLPPDIRVTGATYNDKNIFTYQNSTGGTFDVLFNKVSGLTVNGDITFTGQSNNPVYYAGSGVVVGAQTEITIDFKNSSIQSVTLTGLTKFNTPLNIKDGAIYTIIVKQNATGGNNVNWYTPTFKWENGTFPGITTTANAVDLITFISDGTSLYGLSAKNFS